MSEAARRISPAALGGPSEFRAGARIAGSGAAHGGFVETGAMRGTGASADPAEAAYAEGFAAGEAEALARAAAEAEAREAARGALELAFARFDRALEEELRMRLRETVAALCSHALAPLALDEVALMLRIERAAAMLARADDERVIRLHPDDIALVGERMRAEWRIEADATLERGAVRIEGANGGVEDGPETWRQAIEEALRQC